MKTDPSDFESLDLGRMSLEVKLEIMKTILVLQNEQIKQLGERIQKLEQYNKDKELV